MLPVQIGDYVDVTLSDGQVWGCIIADFKNTKDYGCNAWGHNWGKSVVEIIYWSKLGHSGNQHNKVMTIEKVGSYWEVEE